MWKKEGIMCAPTGEATARRKRPRLVDGRQSRHAARHSRDRLMARLGSGFGVRGSGQAVCPPPPTLNPEPLLSLTPVRHLREDAVGFIDDVGVLAVPDREGA